MHIWLITIVLFVVLLILIVLHNCGDKSSVSRFLNTDSKNIYPSLVKELGQPQVVFNHAGGFVMWYPKQYNPSIPFSSVILKDEQISHSTPDQHYDFLYTTIIINIPEKDLFDILSINKSIFYDRVTRELSVRCNSLNSNRSIIYSVLQRLINPFEYISYNDKATNINILNKLNIVNIKNRDFEGFSQKVYKQIPKSP
jgi:hypothetical protein